MLSLTCDHCGKVVNTMRVIPCLDASQMPCLAPKFKENVKIIMSGRLVLDYADSGSVDGCEVAGFACSPECAEAFCASVRKRGAEEDNAQWN